MNAHDRIAELKRQLVESGQRRRAAEARLVELDRQFAIARGQIIELRCDAVANKLGGVPRL
jgi:hypothetical protein